MANDQAHNPWVLDTEDTELCPKSEPRAVKRVVWQSPANAGDLLLLKDALGNTVVSAVCEVDLQSQVFLVEHTFDGLSLETLDSGTLYVYFN